MANNNGSGSDSKAMLIVFAIIIALGFFVISTGSKESPSKKYDYITNSDGTRTWYNTQNDHIVRVDNP